MARITDKAIRFKQWFAEKYGNEFENFENWAPPQTIADTWRSYMRDLPDYPVSFNFAQKNWEIIQREVQASGKFDAHYKTAELITESFTKFNPDAVINKTHTNNTQSDISAEEMAKINEPVDAKPQTINSMEFPEFKLHRTNTVVDILDSDFEKLGGQYGGVVTICTGESGVGKSTVLIDKLAKYRKVNPDIKICYFSTEMTKNDLYFYNMKNPLIGEVPTILATDYMEGNRLKEAVIQIFEGGYDIILLDSYQDLLGTLKDLLNWTEGAAQRFIIGLMIDSAERLGTCVYAIQHLTKGGQYVGSTFLKHKTTAMMHFKFDAMGNRYVEYSKNRRGGSMQDKPLYYSLNAEGEVVYDEKRFNDLLSTENKSENEKEKAKEFADNFDKIMDANIERDRNMKATFAKHDNDESDAQELFTDINGAPDGAPTVKAEPITTENFNADIRANKNVSERLNDIAEDAEFEEVIEN
jgi:hypothetical protein